MTNYKLKYLKYKSKYLNLKKKFYNYNQFGGDNKSSINKILDSYQDIPPSGIYNNNVKQFEEFCKYLIEETKNNDEVIQVKKKILLEKKKLTNTKEYKILQKKINERGEYYKKLGEDFEEKIFKNIIELLKDKIDISNTQIEILKNPVLYLSNDNENWQTIGEIDAVIIKKQDNINYIIAICEFKHNLDDIPDALFQIKRSYDAINSSKLVKLNDKIIDDKYKFPKNSNYLSIGFIFTNNLNLDNQYFNIQSKLKHQLINIIHTYQKLNYKKILKKIKKKQKYNDKINNQEILRYNMDIFETIELYSNKSLLKIIILI